MANGAERVHRMTGEALHRLRNDHEQFLEAYEKPTQIYRFLKSRQTLKPMFLNRNLSYMKQGPKSRRNRFRKKLKVDDLLSHTRDVKPDLASEIKSDNHLKISFCGLEQGFSLQGLMADSPRVPAEEVEGEQTGADQQCPGNGSEGQRKPEQGQTMEVELLLLKFKQSSVELSEGSHPYSCLSLGKQHLKYKASSSSSENIEDTPLSGSQSEDQDVTLTIPESILTWRGDHSPGTRMLVFRVTYVKRPASKPKRKPVQLINFVSRKGCRKNVAVEVNRLNLADIGQAKTKSKGQQQLGTAVQEEAHENLEGRNDWGAVNGVELGPGGGEASDVVMSDYGSVAAGGLVKCSADNAEMEGRGGGRVDIREQKPSCDVAVSTQVDMPLGAFEGKAKNVMSKHGPLHKKSKSKLKKAKSDASVMTEISFGTDNIPDMPSIGHNSLSPTNHVTESNHSSTFTPPPHPNDHTHAPSHTHSLPTKKGHVHKGTSPKLLFRNGRFNGVLNGYALPEVAAALKARNNHQSTATGSKLPDEAISERKAVSTPVKAKKDNFKYTLTNFTKQKRKRVMKRKLKRHKHPIGTGKRGTRSFLVSIPRVHYDSHLHAVGQANDMASPLSEGGRGGKTNANAAAATHRRRSEIQLLLDGDKPPGQRLSETEIPVFVAEDISNRSSCSTTGPNSIWLGSSTRKITPVEHFTYPLPSLSPTKRAPSIGESTSTSNSPTQHPPSNYRKRTAINNNSMGSSESASSAVFPDQPPPTKQPKVMNASPGMVLCGKGCVQERSEDNLRGNPDVVREEREHPQSCDKSLPVVTTPPPLLGKPPEEKDTPTSTSTAISTTYSAELVVFDSRGECLVRDGEYSILMQCCPPSNSKGDIGLSAFEPLTWDTVFGGSKRSNQDSECPNLLLKFSLCWLHGPPQHRFCSELNTALDIKKIRESYFPPLPPTRSSTPSPSMLAPSNYLMKPYSPAPLSMLNDAGDYQEEVEPEGSVREDTGQALLPLDHCLSSPSSKVFFNFLYSNNTLQQTEAREGLVCPWCSLSCQKIYSLLKHMSLCHPRFQFTYTPNNDGKCVINVHVNKMYSTGSSSLDRDPGERSNVSLVQRRKGPSKCLSCSAMLVERHTEVKEDLSEFLNDGSWKRGYNTNRIYYHSRTTLPMLPKELEAESEEELQTLEWQNTCSQKMIDEFTDVNGGEKEFMKLWNNFAMENKVIADKQIALACIMFARQKGPLLREKGLVPNYMSHLINLFDIGLVIPSILKEGMNAVLGLEGEITS